MVTIYDIVQKCGVSGATASKAPNDHSDISISMKQKIKAAADAMEYSPNIQARSLVTKKSCIIGILFTDDKFMHPFFGEIL